jgi:hypothetical protein
MVYETILSERDKCPKCGSNTLERDPEGDIHCWTCGRTFGRTFPEVGISMNNNDRLLERRRFYENNKAAILADIQSIGRKATAKKWKINGTSLYHALRRWEREAKETVKKSSTEQKDPKITVTSLDGKLPHFPEFSNNWEAPVQLKWLEIYEKLIVRHS